MLFNEYMFEPLIDLKISGSPLKLTNNQGIKNHQLEKKREKIFLLRILIH